MNLSDNDKTRIKKLKLETIDLLVDYDNKSKTKFISIEAYKFPLENVILMEEVYIGQTTSPTIMFVTKEGKVYSFQTNQTGASASPFFDENGKLNIKVEQKFNNVVDFVNFDKKY